MKSKSVKSINPCISVIQTGYDIVKAHGGELKVETIPKPRHNFYNPVAGIN
jgi:hypothetical protein